VKHDENAKDNNIDKQLNSIRLMEYIIRKPMNKETKSWDHDPAVEKLHNMREQMKNDRIN
jgi:hypothetical protein